MIQARGNRILQCNFTCANLIASITYSSISIDIAKNRKSSRMSLRQHNYRDFGMTVIGRNANIILSAIARRSRRSLPPNFPPWLYICPTIAIAFPSPVDLPQRKNRGALAAGRSIAIRNREIGATSARLWYANDRWVCGRRRVPGHYYCWIFQRWDATAGGCLKGRPPRERTTPASIIYYVTLGGEGERRGEATRGSPALVAPARSYRFLFHSCCGPSASSHIIHTTKFELYIR